MAGATGLEPATFGVTGQRPPFYPCLLAVDNILLSLLLRGFFAYFDGTGQGRNYPDLPSTAYTVLTRTDGEDIQAHCRCGRTKPQAGIHLGCDAARLWVAGAAHERKELHLPISEL